jgi:integrase/recombinase XerC
VTAVPELTDRLYTREEVERMLALTRDLNWIVDSRLGPVVQEHLAWYSISAAPRTLDARQRRLAQLCRKCPAATIESLDVSDLMLALEDVPPRSRRIAIHHWNGLIKWAILFDRRSAKNPVDLLPKPKKYTPPAVRTFNDVERSRIIAAAARGGDGYDPARDLIRVYLMHDGGLRRGGCLAMRNRDVNAMRREVVVLEKGEKERVVQIELDDFWIAWLNHMATPYPKMDRTPEPDDYIWFPTRVAGAYGSRPRQVTRCYPEKPLVESGWHRWWYDLLARADVVAPGTTSGRKPHTTRHTFITDALDESNDLYGVKELVGHSSTRVTEAYVHSSDKHKRDVAKKLARSRSRSDEQ